MVKKSMKWIAGIFFIIVAVVIIAGIAVYFIVDKDLIEDQMENALHRHVSIQNINIGIFSVVSGIEVKDVRISNFKTPEQMKELKGKPVAPNDLFVGLDAFVFQVKLLPLLQKEFVLQQLTLKKPQINIVRHTDGSMNFDDLLKATPQTDKKPPAPEKAPPAAETKEEPTADMLPVALSVGKVGIENGAVSFTDEKFKQKFALYDLTALVYDIQIDPNQLEKKNQVKITFNTGVKTIGKMTTGSFKSFDIQLALNGTAKPFETTTKKINPELLLKASSPHGMITGLQIFEALKTIQQLEKYTGKLSFLKDTQEWNDASIALQYKDGIVKFQDGVITTGDYRMKLSGSLNVNKKTVNADIETVLNNDHYDAIKAGIVKNLDGIISKDVEKYIKKEAIADSAMKPLLNEEGKVFLSYKVTGSVDNPSAKLTRPALPKLSGLLKQSLGDIAGMLKKQAEAAAKKEIEKQKKTAEKQVKKEAEKQLKDLKKKLPF